MYDVLINDIIYIHLILLLLIYSKIYKMISLINLLIK